MVFGEVFGIIEQQHFAQKIEGALKRWIPELRFFNGLFDLAALLTADLAAGDVGSIDRKDGGGFRDRLHQGFPRQVNGIARRRRDGLQQRSQIVEVAREVDDAGAMQAGGAPLHRGVEGEVELEDAAPVPEPADPVEI